MSEPSWVGSIHDIRFGEEALKMLPTQNDVRYYTKDEGAIRVDKERWLQAQAFEEEGWLTAWISAQDDRTAEHTHLFNNYESLSLDLGDTLEVGCGPFTQLQSIIPGRTAKSITLLDPLLDKYPTHPNCTYKNKIFFGQPVTTQPKPLEELNDVEAYDTVICINVLEHVIDAAICLDNIFKALRIGGTLVMGERTFDWVDPTRSFDIGHPIHIKAAVLQKFRQRFSKIVYSSTVADDSYNYFIATK